LQDLHIIPLTLDPTGRYIHFYKPPRKTKSLLQMIT
jgi:hypothetical protein